MKPHDTILELAAAGIDFELSRSERSLLETHLAGCPACARSTAAIRGDAATLGHLPPVVLPERRGAEILAAAMHPPAVRHPLRLVLVAALLALLALGSLVAGAELLRRSQEDLSVVVPSLTTETTGPDASAGPATASGWQPVPDQEAVRGVQFLDVAWTGRRFIAVGSGLDGNGAVVDSSDGLTWHRQAAMPGERQSDLAVGSSGVVAIGTIDDRPSSWHSPDGLTWTAAPDAFPATASGTDTIVVTDVLATPSGWLAVGREDPLCQTNCGLDPVRSFVWTSPDGLSWTLIPDQEALLGGGMNAVSAYDGGYVAAGVSAGHAAIWTSPDGTAWSRVPDAAAFHARPGAGAATDTAANGVASSDGIVVVAGADTNDGYGVRAWWSSDGVTWTSVTSETFEGGWGSSIASVSTGLLIAGGKYATPECHAGMWESADGRTWRCTADAALDGFGPQAAASSPAMDLVVGLTSVGYDENSPLGVPGAAWWRSATSEAPAATGPAPSASVMPSASVVPSAQPVRGPTVVPASLPLPSGSVSLAPAAAGGVWALVNGPPNLATESGRAVLALLTKDGEPAAGWPQEIQGVDCSIRAGIPASPASQLPVVAPDGSVRLLCRTASPDATPAVFALSFDAAGAASPGWPVMLPADPVDARMVGDTLVLATSDVRTDASGNVLEVAYRILRISADGQLEQGRAAVTATTSSYDPNLAADGVAFQRWVRDEDTDPATEILAFGFDGALPGWPVSVPGIVSAVVAGADGRYYATASARADWDALAPGQALVALTRSGTLSVGSELPVAGISEATFAGGYAPIRPELDPDGSAWVLGVDARDNVVVHALGPNGNVRDGWPWRAGAPIEERGECDESSGCGVWRTVPALGPAEMFLVLLAPADRTSGGQVVAFGPDGRVMNGWPVELKNRDGRWDLVAAGDDGMVYATAVEPAGTGSATTLLAIAPDSEVVWRSTLVGE